MNLTPKFSIFGSKEETNNKKSYEDMIGSTAVQMEGITKRFPEVVANDHIDFDVNVGEIHALLGENGAGKTTLMNILYGWYQQDEGNIKVWGNDVTINSPKDALHLGIGKVHQLFKQVYHHTVAENIALAVSHNKLFPVRKVKKKFVRFTKDFGWNIDPEAKIWQLSAAKRQQIEIIKTLLQGGNIIILDEPTSVLTPQETEKLFVKLKEMRENGYAIIYITHKLDEVFEISDRVTVLRNGRNVKTLPTSKAKKRELAKLMVGREVIFDIKKEETEKGVPALQIRDLHVRGDQGEKAVNGISLTLKEKEIIGLAGIGGNGQKELIEALTGLRKVQEGSFLVSGNNLTNASPRKIKEHGVAYIPEERTRRAVVPKMSVKENLILRDYYKEPYSRGLFFDMTYIKRNAEKKIVDYNILAPNLDAPVGLLSGGNLQRVILAREVARQPKILIAAYPTRGLDVQSAVSTRKLLLEQRKNGSSIFFTSEELDEIIMLSDRIAVIYEGELMGIVDASKIKKEELGLMMAGTPKEAAV